MGVIVWRGVKDRAVVTQLLYLWYLRFLGGIMLSNNARSLVMPSVLTTPSSSSAVYFDLFFAFRVSANSNIVAVQPNLLLNLLP